MVKPWKTAAILLVTFILAISLSNEFFLFLLGFELMLLCAAFAETVYLAGHLRMRISLPERMAVAGKTFTLCAELENTSRLPLPQLMVCAAVRVFPDKEEYLLRGKLMLDSREKGTLRFEMDSSHTACLEVRPERLVITDHLGLIQRRCPVDREDIHLLFVLPDTSQAAEELPDDESSILSEDGDARQRGQTAADTADIRVYHPGDPVRLIHWKLSARLDELMLREMSDPAEQLVWIWLELREEDEKHNSRLDRDVWDRFMETVDAVSCHLLMQGQKHVIAWPDAEEDSLVTMTVEDEESRRAMLCRLLRAKTYAYKDYRSLLREVYTDETGKACFEISLQGRIIRSAAER